MLQINRTLKATLLVIALFLGIIALRPMFAPATIVQAQAARFDHVFILSTMFLYKGQQGLLLLDRRNGNIWFVPKKDEIFQDPIFVIRMQFEKLDQSPR
jgi:hypothetical protein